MTSLPGDIGSGERQRWSLIAITTLGLLLRVYMLGKQGFWFDEAFTVFVARLPASQALQALLADGVHPPLYYLLQRITKMLGESELVYRSPSVIFGVAAIPTIYQLGKSWVGPSVGLLAATLLAVSPFHIWHSRDARMYSMLMFLGLVAMLSYWKLLHHASRRWELLFIGSSSLAYLTHYFGFMMPLTQFLHLASTFRRNHQFLRRWVSLQLFAALPFSIWVYLLAQRPDQVFGIGWIPRPDVPDLAYSLINLTVGYLNHPRAAQWIWLGFSLVILGLGIWSLRRHRADWELAAIWAFMPIGLIFVLSARRPTYIDRVFIVVLPALLILLSSGVMALRGRLAQSAGLIAVVALAVGTATYVFGPTQLKEGWREAADRLEGSGENSAIVVRVQQMLVPLVYYYEGPSNLEALEINRQVRSIDQIATGRSVMWLLFWNANVDAHRVAANPDFDASQETDETVAAWIAGGGPKILERVDWPGVTAFKFSLAP